MSVGELSIDADEVFSWPVSVAERSPGVGLVVENDRPLDSFTGDSCLDIFDSLFELELRGVYSENNQAIVGVLGMPFFKERKGSEAVDARVGPEIDEHDFVIGSLISDFERLGIEPSVAAVNF
jgi:hypothetical protein